MQNDDSKYKNKKLLERAVDFHGHLGPYLVLGLLMGELVVKRLKAKKYFGIEVKVKGVMHKPKSCLIDGIQISTGCTLGKGNIKKCDGKTIQVNFKNSQNNKKVRISLVKNLVEQLDRLKGHREAEIFARRLLKIDFASLFELKFLN